MESATIAAQGYRFRVPYGTLLCVSDKPLHGELKLPGQARGRSEEHTSELQSLMRISYAVFCLKKKKKNNTTHKLQTQSSHNSTINIQNQQKHTGPLTLP